MGLLDDLSDAWRADEAFNILFGCNVAVPPGFAPYARDAWRNRFGDATHHQLSLRATGDDLSGLAKLTRHELWRLDVRHRRIDDDAFDAICRFDELEELDAAYTAVTDVATHGMHTLQELRWLSLSGCAITDAALAHLVALRALQHLDLSATRVTDAGLSALVHHPHLRVLNLRDTAVTGADLAPLLTLPELRQVWMNHRQHRHAHRFIHEHPEVEILY
jgi:hypothetical protein